MKSLNYLAIALASLALLACKPDSSPTPKLFEEQRNALDKTKAVEKTVQQQTQETQQSIEKQAQ